MPGWSINARAWRIGFEAGDDLFGVHARLDDLERDLAADGALLLGEEDDPHPPLAELADDCVGADARAGALGDRGVGGEAGRFGRSRGRGTGLMSGDVRIVSGRGPGGGGEEDAGAHVGLEEFLDLPRTDASPWQASSR